MKHMPCIDFFGECIFAQPFSTPYWNCNRYLLSFSKFYVYFVFCIKENVKAYCRYSETCKLSIFCVCLWRNMIYTSALLDMKKNKTKDDSIRYLVSCNC